MLDALIFDLDGVIRHYDRTHERDIERKWQIPTGTLLRTAFGGELGQSFMLGKIDHAEFELELATLLGSRPAATEFVAMTPKVDDNAVALVRYLQDRMPVALLTNGSTRTQHELAATGLSDAFHHIFNSAETGVAKPDPQAYLNVLEILGTAPERTAFIDDHEPNITGARSVGLVGHIYTDLNELEAFLRSSRIELPERDLDPARKERD